MESLKVSPMLPVYNDLPCCIFWKDREFTYQGGNTQFLQAIGFKEIEEIIGKSDYELPWTEDADLYRQSDLLILEGKSILSKELRWHVDGPRYMIVNKVPIKDENDEITGILGIHKEVKEYLDLSSNAEDLFPRSSLKISVAASIPSSELELFASIKNLSDDPLTNKEIECLSLWLSGYSIKESAYCLKLSHKSIEAYRKNIKDKMSVYHKYQLIELMQIKGAFHLYLTLAKLIHQKSN
jgi:DNA-binding CsgD family transcriptional regulator